MEKALFRANLTVDQVDWLLLHQANQRILDAVAQRLTIGPQKVLSNLARYGNTSAASIPLALDEAVRQGKIQPSDIIAAAGFGAGLTWGAAIFQWGR
jgi:3-oxoacyl-[acyl-carrier-protein] synthase-3